MKYKFEWGIIKKCDECPCCDEYGWCFLRNKSTNYDKQNNGLPDDCPLKVEDGE